MDPERELILHIDPGSATIKVESRSPEGSIITKRIGYNALVECIKGSLQRGMIQSGLLPAGCISYDAGDDGWRYVAIEHPERYADITYEEKLYPHFPLPRLVFRFGLHMGLRVQGCQMGVVAEGRLTPDTPMFHYPFSNVSGFHLCTGGNILPECKSLHTLSSLPYLILEMPNNNDHFMVSHNQLGLEHRDLLEYMKDKSPDYYYEKVLIPSGRTLKEFFQ